jgi:hypothetical protein
VGTIKKYRAIQEGYNKQIDEYNNLFQDSDTDREHILWHYNGKK